LHKEHDTCRERLEAKLALAIVPNQVQIPNYKIIKQKKEDIPKQISSTNLNLDTYSA